MAMYRTTISGLYNYNNALFDKMIFPSGADKQVFISSLMIAYGDCEPLYPDWDFLHDTAIPAWSAKWKTSIDKVYNVLDQLSYEPIENYDRHEEWTDSPDITRTSQSDENSTTQLTAGQKQKTSQTGQDVSEDTVSAFNSSTYEPSQKNTMDYGNSVETENSGTDTGTSQVGRNETQKETGTTTHTGHIHGNIGVTTSQQMIQSELELRKQSFIDYCTGLFASDLLLLVY